MKVDELFDIDVAAELATLCQAQLQGSWQVPAEVVRLASRRGSSRVHIDTVRGGLRLACDGSIVSLDDLRDLVEVFDPSADRGRRQDAISRIETTGVSALLWAAGLPRARLDLTTRSSGRVATLRVQRGRVALETGEGSLDAPSTTVIWRCGGLDRRRSVAWLRTALRFIPMPVVIGDRPVERGFPDGLFRMRVGEPLVAELAVTATGELPSLWLLEHGVLSTRAVVPGYPGFSAAIEMSDQVPSGSSAGELRAAANPHLERLIDQAAGMVLALVDRLPTVGLAVRDRLSSLALGFALRGIRRERILDAPVVATRWRGERRMATPREIARAARLRGGVVRATEPTLTETGRVDTLVVEATAEERGLLSELLDIRIECADARSDRPGVWARAAAIVASRWQAARALWGARELPAHRLNEDERRLVETAAEAGVELGLCAGAGSSRMRRSRTLVGRERGEVRSAARVTALSGDWVYPALLALTGGRVEIPDAVRNRWLGSLTPGPPMMGAEHSVGSGRREEDPGNPP